MRRKAREKKKDERERRMRGKEGQDEKKGGSRRRANAQTACSQPSMSRHYSNGTDSPGVDVALRSKLELEPAILLKRSTMTS